MGMTNALLGETISQPTILCHIYLQSQGKSVAFFCYASGHRTHRIAAYTQSAHRQKKTTVVIIVYTMFRNILYCLYSDVTYEKV